MQAGRTEHEELHALKDAYEAFAGVVSSLGEEESWLPSGCAGWAVRDLLFHCVGDAQRGLVALHTPADGPADRDAVTYWANWQPGTAGAADEQRHARVAASMFLEFEQLRELHLATAAAVVTAAERSDPQQFVRTQGHVLTAAALMATLSVEATIHHLDLVAHLPAGAPRPGAAGLACVRGTIDGLLGRPVPVDWSDEHYALAATGRLRLTAAEKHRLGADAGRFPLFG
ncbi:MAG TPA: maleylpyruvate isomerase N-terminal domain-containing protein [Streptomyces sp.]|uniref:maleylpyruvate isomerase N-terminal domain-containing protein n=1 Tax=Streptomyces sp. TaxID=1931 RepID=UPI002CB9853C|nr:maleylpyruvate isomerase N-terminal domain-containing protein [Streptomyces sp.]HWU09837.1 maleylpyruvate isomerase N-terminal domain-containing protein [Streptomyces sp.]